MSPEPDGESGAAVRTSSKTGAFPDAATSLLIARQEGRRGYRKIRQQDVWLALILVGVLTVVLVLPIVFDVARDGGEAIASGDSDAADLVVFAGGGYWLAIVVLSVIAGVGSNGAPDNPGRMLTVRPPEDVAGGLALGAAASFSLYVYPPFAAAALGLSVGVGSPLPLVGALIVATTVLVTGVSVGFPIGVAIKGAVRRSAALSRYKPVLGALVAVAYFWIALTGRLFDVLELIAPAVVNSPPGWLGELALLWVPGAEASALHAVGAVCLAVLVVPVGLLGLGRAAEYAWFADPADPPEDADASSATDATPPLTRVLSPLCRNAGTLGVAEAALVRAYRAPFQLLFVAVPLLAAIPLAEQVVTTGTAPDYLPWLVVLYGAMAAGAAFPLNALGNQGATLPTLLTASIDGRQVVHGNVLAGVVLAAPPTTSLAVAAGVLSGRSGSELLVVGVVAPVVVVAGAVLAAGVGALFPRFQSIDVTAERTATLPSKVAFALFALAISLAVYAVAVVTDELMRLLASVVLSERLPFGLTVDPGAVETIAWVVLPVLAAAVPVAYVVAVRRIGGYRLD
jgi:hypothetical protein